MENKRPVFTVNMLGGLSFYYDDREFTLKCSQTSKVMQLFLLLLGAGEDGIPRVQLLEFLYGREDTQDTKNAFRILVFRLRRILEDTIILKDNYIVVEKGIYRFGGHLDVRVDYKLFLEHASQALEMEDTEEKIGELKQVCESYSGELLPFLSKEEWVAAESVRCKDKYFDCLREACRLLKKKGRYEEVLGLCGRAIELYPFEEWQLVQIDCLLAMNRYKEALKVYEDSTTLFFEELGLSPSEKMLARFRAMSGQIHYAMGTLTDIRSNLKEKQFLSGAYYCSYPSFIDSYRIIVRMIERSGLSVFLMLCTLTDSKGNPMEREDLLTECAAHLNQAIGKSLRRGDLYTRCSRNQFLILLIGIKQEDCEVAFMRINAKFREMCPHQKVQLRYYVSSVAEIRKEKTDLHFGASGNRWRKK